MTQTSEDSGGGIAPIGTAGSVCAISPSDLVGTVDNIIGRIEKIEQVLMQIATGNIWANQLSDLSQQVGWLTGVTYMGIPGWTQTEYGTLIPPPGFTLLGNGITLSDGNTYQAVVMDENGVLQFGFTPIGGVVGEKAEQWDAGVAGEMDYGSYSWEAVGGLRYTVSRNVTITPDLGSKNVSMTVTNAGLYWIGASGHINAAAALFLVGISVKRNSIEIGSGGVDFGSTPMDGATGSWSGAITCNAGDTISITASSNPVGSLGHISLSVVRLSAS